MILTKDNLEEWKVELDKEAERRGLYEDAEDTAMSETLDDADWLKDCIGEDTKEVIADEIYYAMQDR